MTTMVSVPALASAGWANAFGNEVGKGLRELAGGWRAVVIEMITFPLFYLLIVMFMGRGHLLEELLVPVLIGLVGLAFIHEQINRMFWSYLGDLQSGVLEQTYLTPLPSAALILGRQAAAVIGALPVVATLLVTGFIAVTAKGGTFPFELGALIPAAAIVVGTCALALVLCGLTLVFKRIESITQASIAVYAIIGGTLVPLSALPDWIASASRALIPVAPGVEAVRAMLLDGAPLTELDAGWGLGWILLQPVLLTGLGIFLFTRLERVAKSRGTLGRY
ncbi:ABC transporter permease [Glycomyces tritici]|uniref:ABC transporter permease n=1 Tax=Glycomyces tritici TaxID=2665176 RepID=A0ABT7YWW8_9ACTN|nr:ABC transporter permease [Glycomyces tritici]MDN3243140.1 ABC transporter permease [Glycomyces tritici]